MSMLNVVMKKPAGPTVNAFSLPNCIERKRDLNLHLVPLSFPRDPRDKLTLSLPRVINFKFPLRPHQKYCITQYQELDFS